MVSFHRSAQVATEQHEDGAVNLSLPTEPRSAAAFPRVNLMPEVVAAEARTHRAKVVLVGVAGASVLVVAGLYVLALGSVNQSQDQLDAAHAQSAVLASEAAKYADVPKVQAQVAAASQQQYNALGGEVRWTFLLNNLALTIPAGTSLTSFAGSVTPNPPSSAASATPGANTNVTSVLGHPGIGTIAYGGEAVGTPQVANFLDSQAKQKTLVDPFVTTVVAPAEGGTSKAWTFTSTATITSAALSHRYDMKAGS